MVLRVTIYGEEILRQKGEPVVAFDESLKQLAADMLETMHAHEGIGLAAQQVERNLLLFVADMRVSERNPEYEWKLDGRKVPLELFMPLVAVNAQIETSGPEGICEEGCLSFPHIRGDVVRPENVIMRYQDLNGTPHTVEANGLFGRVIQHEFDHTQGVLFIERIPTRNRRALDSKLKKLKRLTRDRLKTKPL